MLPDDAVHLAGPLLQPMHPQQQQLQQQTQHLQQLQLQLLDAGEQQQQQQHGVLHVKELPAGGQHLEDSMPNNTQGACDAIMAAPWTAELAARVQSCLSCCGRLRMLSLGPSCSVSSDQLLLLRTGLSNCLVLAAPPALVGG